MKIPDTRFKVIEVLKQRANFNVIVDNITLVSR